VLLCGYGASDAAAAVASRADAGVEACYLFGSPNLDDALRATHGDVVIVPYLMSDGVTCAALRDKAAAHREASGHTVLVTAPLGEHPGLADIVENMACAAAAREGLMPQATSVLLVTHGTARHPASLDVARRLAGAMRRTWQGCVFSCLEGGPTVTESATDLPPGPIVSVGLFLDRGNHARMDLPAELAACGRSIVHAGCLGEADGLAALVRDLVLSASASAEPSARRSAMSG